jgi:hypothetical protein
MEGGITCCMYETTICSHSPTWLLVFHSSCGLVLKKQIGGSLGSV